MKPPQAPKGISSPVVDPVHALAPRQGDGSSGSHLGLEVIPIETHYPHFDVMKSADRWDAYTREVVESRLDPRGNYRTLSNHEAKTLQSIAMHLLYEDRKEILAFVIAHVDQQLGETIGEAQREVGLPPQSELIRTGLASLDLLANARHGIPFIECDVDQQFALLSVMQLGKLEPITLSDGAPKEMQMWADPTETTKVQKAFFKRLLGLLVEALASYPTIWSEMGYAGPAYPRGYYRIARGLTDPWEARAPASKS